MSGQLREWLMAWRAFAGNPGLLIHTGLCQPQQGFQHLRAGACPLRNPVLVVVLQMFHCCHHSCSWLAPCRCRGVSQSPRTECPWGGGGPGTQSCPWSSSGREPATGSSVITSGFIHGLNLNGKSREAPVYLLLPFI